MAAPAKRAARRIPRQIDEDDEEVAATPTQTTETETDEPTNGDKHSPIRRGWSAGRQVVDSTSSFAQTFKLTEAIQVIKFLEDDPYASYTRHWVERQSPTGRVNRSYNCLKSFERDCPVCEAGDKAQAVVAFNIALIGDDGVPTLKSFDCGPKLLSILEGYARDPKVAPLSKGYFLASRSGKKGTVNYQLPPIRAASLKDEYDIDVPSADELAKLGLYDADVITMPKLKDMEDIAAEIADEY